MLVRRAAAAARAVSALLTARRTADLVGATLAAARPLEVPERVAAVAMAARAVRPAREGARRSPAGAVPAAASAAGAGVCAPLASACAEATPPSEVLLRVLEVAPRLAMSGVREPALWARLAACAQLPGSGLVAALLDARGRSGASSADMAAAVAVVARSAPRMREALAAVRACEGAGLLAAGDARALSAVVAVAGATGDAGGAAALFAARAGVLAGDAPALAEVAAATAAACRGTPAWPRFVAALAGVVQPRDLGTPPYARVLVEMARACTSEREVSTLGDLVVAHCSAASEVAPRVMDALVAAWAGVGSVAGAVAWIDRATAAGLRCSPAAPEAPGVRLVPAIARAAAGIASSPPYDSTGRRGALIAAGARADIPAAFSAFEAIEAAGDIAAMDYAVLADACCAGGQVNRAERVLRVMMDRGLAPTPAAVCPVLRAHAAAGAALRARDMLDGIVAVGVDTREMHAIVLNALATEGRCARMRICIRVCGYAFSYAVLCMSECPGARTWHAPSPPPTRGGSRGRCHRWR